MAAPSALISLQNGSNAAANLASGANAYVDPGASLTVALQSSTGVVSWTITISSDYAPLNGWTLTQGQNGPFSMALPPAPVTPAKIVILSEVTDGNNNYPVQNSVYCYPSLQAPDRVVRGIATQNINLGAANILLVATGLANDGLSNWTVGQRVLCVAQATQTQNGPYVISNVNANIATLVRPPDYVTGQVVPPGQVYEVSEGTAFANTSWKLMQAGNVTVDTTNTNTWFPRMLKGVIANANGSGLVSNLWVAPAAVVTGVATSGTTAVIIANFNSGSGNGNITLSTTVATTNAAYVVNNW
jgi:hypothetical protein